MTFYLILGKKKWKTCSIHNFQSSFSFCDSRILGA